MGLPLILLEVVSGMEPDWSPTARDQRGPFKAARCASTGDHPVPSLLRSASKRRTQLPQSLYNRLWGELQDDKYW